MVARRLSGRFVLAVVLVTLAAAVAVRVLGPSRKVVASAASPDGSSEARLVQVSWAGAKYRSYDVCLRQLNDNRDAPTSCSNVAHLLGVPDINGRPGVELLWRSAVQLDVRYAHASSAPQYQPEFFWPSSAPRRFPLYGNLSRAPITIRVVRELS